MMPYLARDRLGWCLLAHKPEWGVSQELWMPTENRFVYFSAYIAAIPGFPQINVGDCVEVKLEPVEESRPHFWVVRGKQRQLRYELFIFHRKPRRNGLWWIDESSSGNFYGWGYPEWDSAALLGFPHYEPAAAALIIASWTSF